MAWSPPGAPTPGDSRLNLGDYAALNSNQLRDGTVTDELEAEIRSQGGTQHH
jgi:hypothetical protein